MSNKKIIKWYLAGTFLQTYIVWGVLIVCNHFGYFKKGSIGFWILFALGGLASTIFGAYLSKKSGKVGSYKALLFEAISVKSNPLNYLLVFVFFAIYFGVPFIARAVDSISPWYIGLLNVLMMIFFGGLEEVGWRYIFQPTLENHIPFWGASVITGGLWALWHLPLFFIEGMNKGFGLFILNTVAMSFLLGAIYRVSKNLWLCILLHALINAFMQVWMIHDSITITIIMVSVQIISALAVVGFYVRKSRLTTV